jgi:hypothetical protein
MNAPNLSGFKLELSFIKSDLDISLGGRIEQDSLVITFSFLNNRKASKDGGTAFINSNYTW